MKLVRLLQSYYSTSGLLNAGESVGLIDALATQMVAAGTAVLIDDGAGSGVPTTSAFRGILASETPAQYATAGGTLGAQPVSAAIQGFIGGADVTIINGHAQPNSEPWA
jgi:hypothetical protein